MKKPSLPNLTAKKALGEKIVMLTCYDASFAKILDAGDVDLLLVGDSLGMVIQGHETTLPVTIDEMVYHTRCVTRGAKATPVVADLPFMSYQASIPQALLNAGRCLKEGLAHAVKLEGGSERVATVRALVEAGIPVMGHIGLKPQMIHQLGGYKIQGKTPQAARNLVQEAIALEEAGAFALVLEGIMPEVARQITEQVKIPTIGIASGPHCDGQVLVLYDVLGMDSSWSPSYVKRHMEGHALVLDAVNSFAKEVRQGFFPKSQEKTQGKEELRVVHDHP